MDRTADLVPPDIPVSWVASMTLLWIVTALVGYLAHAPTHDSSSRQIRTSEGGGRRKTEGVSAEGMSGHPDLPDSDPALRPRANGGSGIESDLQGPPGPLEAKPLVLFRVRIGWEQTKHRKTHDSWV